MNKKPNIMLVISTIGGAGAELVVANLCKNIDRNKFNVCVCHLKERGEKGDELIQKGYEVIGLSNNRNTLSKYTLAFQLHKLVKTKKIDILHSHNVEPLFECALCKLITPGVKLVHTYHYGNYPHLQTRYLIMEGIYSRVADVLVAVGFNQKKQIARTYRISPSKIHTIYNGISIVNIHKFSIKKELLGNRDQVIIGSISTFIYQKGIDILLEIAEEIRVRKHNVIFWVVGDGPLRSELDQKRKRMGLEDTVKFMGWIPNAAEIVLPEIDIFLQTSRWEAMSMVILEAMAAGKAIIATDVGENRRIIEGAQAGYIVSQNDINSAAMYLEKLVNNPMLRYQTGMNGKESASKYFSVDRMTKKYENLYASIVPMYNDLITMKSLKNSS